MSWINRARGGGAPPQGPDQLLYNAPQQFSNEQATYPNYQAGTQANTPQQQYWPMPQQNSQYNQQYDQMYNHPNANQFFQQPIQPGGQYNQNHNNQSFNNTQQGYPQNFYPNQATPQQNCPQKKANADNWEDNWGWGWEDSSKQIQQSVSQSSQQMPRPQQQAFNNANVIEESFASTDTWNWSMDDKKETNQPSTATPSLKENRNPATLSTDNGASANRATDASQASTSDKSDDVKTLGDRDIIKEHLPTLALGKRFHLENLTPQWSIESQMSQESSDGPHTHSESTYRSENQSRNSSKSSPGLNSETLNFNYSQSGVDESYTQNSERSRLSTEEASLGDKKNRSGSRQDSHDDITTSLQEMSIANCENPTPDSIQSNKEKDKIEKKHLSENISPASRPTPSVSPANFPPPLSSVLAPPSTTLPPNIMSAPTSTSGQHYPPPTNFPTSQNPFKHAGPFSHKTISKTPQANPFTNQTHPSQSNGTNLTSPSAVNKVSQHNRVPVAFGANLETTPDNSERPDQPQISTYRPMSVSQQVPENMEVAPKNDRNEYLQTAHLSSSDYGVNTDFSRNISLPGLRRTVVGQQESEYNQSMAGGDEPPPGLARMVPGQQTESDSVYNQPTDNYMDRHVDGQTTDISGPYRQADGQQTPHSYKQSASNRGSERRPVGLDRMVPGEPSNDEYLQYQVNYSTPNEQRVVTGLDHDYPTDAGPADRREQNVDGSDYSEQALSNQNRNIIGAQETNEVSIFNATAEEGQREVTMEGENLQDLSVISSTELSYSRGVYQILDGANVNIIDATNDRKTDRSDSVERPTSSSRRQSINRVNTSGEDSERDKVFKSSPRRDRDKRKSSKDRDRDRGRDTRQTRGDRKYDRDNDRKTGRDERRSEKDRDRGERDRNRRDDSPNSRRHRRSTRSRRYETEDTDYYSDRERERRRYREGSYSSSKPPRPDDKDRRHRDERNRRYNTIERDRRYDDEREGAGRSRKSEHRERDRYERRYRDIDPDRKYGNLRREEEERRRAERGEPYSSPSRAESREAAATDDDSESRRRADRHRRHRADAYLGGPDPYALQRQQYQYYEHLRLTNPVAYMEVYKQLMGGHVAAAHSPRSGRSSANDTAARLDTELNTDASLNLHLEESTVRSERMTPLKFCTAHAKGTISSRHVVVVRPSYPVDGLPATVQVLDLASALARDPTAQELAAFPGPLVRGVTHKKSVAEYCARRVRSAPRDSPDAAGYALLWQLLALMLRQNGSLAGADVSELLVNDANDHPHQSSAQLQEATSRRGSSTEEGGSVAEAAPVEENVASERAALDTLRAHLIVGNRQEALEWAMSARLWGHALQLAAHGSRRERAAVSARFVASLPPTDPLHTLYAALAQRQPPAAVCAADARWADWRPHAAMLLANASAKPEQDARTLVQLGDSLAARGLPYSAQFCYVAAGVPFARHPLAPLASGPAPESPPRLSLLLADPRAATLAQHASNQAIFATEVYEYALSLRQECPHALEELQPYKFLMACRLVDAGRYGRALAYVEQVARATTQAPQRYPQRLLALAVELGERLKYHDPALQEVEESVDAEEGEASEGSPRHAQRWLQDLRTAQHRVEHSPQAFHREEAAHAWPEQHIQQNVEQPPLQTYSEQMEDSPDYSHFYGQPAPAAPFVPVAPVAPVSEPPGPVAPEPLAPPAPAPLYDPYWGHTDNSYSYGERQEPEETAERPPAITMPGASRSTPYADYDDAPMADRKQRETESPAPATDKSKKREEGKGKGGGGGWFGGLFTKLSLRPPNQMILPDDKDPAIVWDAATQRWRDRDGSAEGEAGPPPPPPTMADLALASQHRSSVAPPPGQLPPSGPLPPPTSGPNIFKMQKSRHIKKSYVDVLNPGAGSSSAPAPAPAATATATAPVDYFVPAPFAEPQGAAEVRHAAI